MLSRRRARAPPVELSMVPSAKLATLPKGNPFPRCTEFVASTPESAACAIHRAVQVLSIGSGGGPPITAEIAAAPTAAIIIVIRPQGIVVQPVVAFLADSCGPRAVSCESKSSQLLSKRVSYKWCTGSSATAVRVSSRPASA
jgi:hypothetical protein